MAERANERPNALSHARSWLKTALGRGGLVLAAIATIVLVLVVVLLVVTWFTGLGPEVPGREHY